MRWQSLGRRQCYLWSASQICTGLLFNAPNTIYSRTQTGERLYHMWLGREQSTNDNWFCSLTYSNTVSDKQLYVAARSKLQDASRSSCVPQAIFRLKPWHHIFACFLQDPDNAVNKSTITHCVTRNGCMSNMQSAESTWCPTPNISSSTSCRLLLITSL